MAKPPPDVQARIAALPRNDPGRGPDLLHVTLMTLFDLHHAPPDWLPAVIAALDSFDGVAFPLSFDRIENRKAVTLRTRDLLPEARAFQTALVRHLLAQRAPMMLGTTPEPHVTINYRGDRARGEKMPPIGWTVDTILLVESVVGKATLRISSMVAGRCADARSDRPMTYARDAKPPFYHGTRADLRAGDLLVAGRPSNFADDWAASWIYFAATLDAAIWGAELARGDVRERIYLVEPTGPFEDDPNLTDKKFPGNITASYRSRDPLRVIGEITDWEPHPPEQLQAMKDGIAQRRAAGGGEIID